MTKPAAKQIEISNRDYSCTGCGQCCRRWHVYLPAPERERLARLNWAAEDRIPEKRTVLINRLEYIAHTRTGECIYLESEKNTCNIHRKFGYDAKPLGCKVYPYNIATTFPGKFSVIGRFDCPAVRANRGRPMRQAVDDIRAFIKQMGLTGGFDEGALNGLAKESVRQILPALEKYVLDNAELAAADKMIVAAIAANRLEVLGNVFLNNVELPEILPSFFKRLISDHQTIKPRRLGAFEQWRFLSVLSAFLRRDEEVAGKGFAARFKRAAAMFKVYFGKANLRALGAEHPDFSLDRKTLFSTPVTDAAGESWQLLFDLVKSRLEAFQFFGPANYNLTFFPGLRSLFVLFPLVMATAKWHALARDPRRCVITPADVDYAVAAIDHSFGRSDLLRFGFIAALSRQLGEPDNFIRLMAGLLGRPE